MNIPAQQLNGKKTLSSSPVGSVFESIVLVIICVLAYIYLLGPKLEEYNARKTAYNDVVKQYNSLKDQEQTFVRLQAELKDKVASVTTLDAMLPLNDKLTRLYILVEYLANRTGLNAPSIVVESNSSAPSAGNKEVLNAPFASSRSIQVIPIVVSGTGTVEQLNNFLHLLEVNTRILDVSNLEISQGKEDQLIFKVSVQAYAYSPIATDKSSAGIAK